MLPMGFYDFADEVNGNASGREYSDKTYNLDSMSGDGSGVSVGSGVFIGGREAVSQAVVKILNTERFRYPIYSTDYGIETDDLFGMDCDYVCVELERRISEALLADNRIIRVSGFSFTTGKNVVYASFIVYTMFGEHRFEDLGIAI
jgi:hypothetical protein